MIKSTITPSALTNNASTSSSSSSSSSSSLPVVAKLATELSSASDNFSSSSSMASANKQEQQNVSASKKIPNKAITNNKRNKSFADKGFGDESVQSQSPIPPKKAMIKSVEKERIAVIEWKNLFNFFLSSSHLYHFCALLPLFFLIFCLCVLISNHRLCLSFTGGPMKRNRSSTIPVHNGFCRVVCRMCV
jgi:hypothetical protein